MAMVPHRIALAGALALSLGATVANQPLRAQTPDSGASAATPPRGQVVADCYARAEVWQGDGRVPLRLLFTRVAYNETTSGGLRHELASEWNKFILPRLAGAAGQAGQTMIVYCQYADSATNTELSRWPATAPAPERVEWPGHSLVTAPVTSAPAVSPTQPPPAAPPPAAPMAAAPAPMAVAPAPGVAAPPPMTPMAPQPPPASALAVPAPTLPVPAQAELPQAQEESVQAQQANAVYDDLRRKNEQHIREERARNDAYLRQVEEYQRQMAATQAAQRDFEERQKKYEQERAAYEAQNKGK